MNFSEYSNETARTMAYLGHTMADEMHMVIGVSTEASELLDAYKKKLAYRKDIDIVNVKEEIGDMFWYLSNYMRIMDMDFEDILEMNVAKLKTRYKDAFSKEQAIYRDTEEERIVMEKLSERIEP